VALVPGPSIDPGPAGDGPWLFAYAAAEALASCDFAAHLWASVESGMVAQYRVAMPSLGSGVLQASSPILDLKGPLSTLPWCEQMDWKEQNAVASATAPAAITSELSMASQGATQQG